jgi:hypothetical protein
MNRFANLTHEREDRSPEDSFAEQRIKLYKELRRLSDLDAPAPRPSRDDAPGATPGTPDQA